MFSKILVPLDGSKTAEKVLPYARYLASRFKIPIELLAVVDIAEIASQIASEKPRFLDTFFDDAVQQRTSYLSAVAASFAEADVSYSVERGKAEEAIVERAARDKAALIAMATHGRSGVNRFLLGSVAEKVLRGTVNPLLLIRAAKEAKSEGEAALKSIIVPLDGSELGEGVLPLVADIAQKLSLEVELLRAYHIPSNVYADDWGFSGSYDELLSGLRVEASEYLEKKAADLKRLGVAKVTCVTKEGLAADEIISLGQKTADNLIAMSSHGRSGVTRWALGSVAETVVRHSSNPVLIIRPG